MSAHDGDNGQDGGWNNPFGAESNENAEVNPEDDDRLTGVRTADPFADDREQRNEDLETVKSSYDDSPLQQEVENAPLSATSPGGGSRNLESTEYFEQTSGVSTEQPNTNSNSAIIDHAVSATATEPTPSKDATGADLDTVNSNVNGDRAERGTDVYANANPSDKESESSSQSPESESDSGHEDEKPRVAFADKDEIDKSPTQDDDEPHDFVDKIKSTVSKVKSKIHLQEVSAKGPIKRMNPTSVRMRLRFEDDPERDVGIIWRSRDNRKGRNSVAVPRTAMAYPNLPSKNRPVYTSSFKGVRRNLWRMAFTFPYWDMAFWSGWSYTWGSVLFVIDGTWAWIPVGWPEYPLNEGIETYALGIFFFVGAMLYQLGAVMAWLEAVNDGSFHGSSMKRFLEGHEEDKKKMLDEKFKGFFKHLNPAEVKKEHEEEEAELEKQKTVDPESGWRTVPRRERMGSIYPQGKHPGPRRGGVDLGEPEEGETHEYLEWRWWPTWHAFRYHHIYEIGYVACSIQLFGATLYSWCGLDALHGLSDTWTKTEFYGAYWFPEILGSCCFLSASFMFLLETQEKWYKPEPKVMGWWIGFWAMIGSWGFLLNGLFGVVSDATGQEWAEFQSECATTWGSFGYLCSALCQWYEAVNKHPIEEGYFDDSGDIENFQVHNVDVEDK